MKYLSVLIVGLALSLYIPPSFADGVPTNVQCKVNASMVSTVQRMRIKYNVPRASMLIRAKVHTPPALQSKMIEAINLVYDKVPRYVSPKVVYREFMNNCTGIKV